MKREIDKLANIEFDVIVVGSGIHGAIVAMAAAKAGYQVALLEKSDFGHATSANSLKVIHGGIRYLQHGDFKRMRESIVSRRAMMRFAPHLVHPLPCMMPTYGHGIRGREIMRTAFAVYDVVAWDRNLGLEPENRLPLTTSISPREVRWVVPGIKSEGLTGGAVWYDAIATNTERLVLEYVKEAARYGVSVANYAEVVKLNIDGGKVRGLVVRDGLTGNEICLTSRVVVNAAGPWLAELVGSKGDLSRQQWTTAVNIVVRKQLFNKYAVGLEGFTEYSDQDALIKRGKRLFFFVPWQNGKYTMIGTAYKPYHGLPNDFAMSSADLQEILNDINKIYPPGQLTLGDVSFFHAGLLPMTGANEQQQDSVQLDKSSKIIDHGITDGIGGLLSIKGVKYTTAPDIAKKLVKQLRSGYLAGIGVSSSRYQALTKRKERIDFGPAMAALGNNLTLIKEYLTSRYGTGWRDVFFYIVMDHRQSRLQDEEFIQSLWICKEPHLLKAELQWFIHGEMANSLADVVFRRSNLAAAECPAPETLDLLAQAMGEALGWSDEERQRQIEQVIRVFAPLQV